MAVFVVADQRIEDVAVEAAQLAGGFRSQLEACHEFHDRFLLEVLRRPGPSGAFPGPGTHNHRTGKGSGSDRRTQETNKENIREGEAR